MHPADQFEAFFTLHSEDGMSAEDIAARFGVTAAVVRQRLKLAAVSPVLMQAYRDEELNLDQLTGFAITDDHARQEQVWEQLGYDDSREAILNALTEEHVVANDRRARFIGLDAYQAAGGSILRDLFDDEGGGFLTDEGDDQAEIDRIESAIAALQGEDVFDHAVIGMAGAIVSIGHDGEARIERGFIRREDDSRAASRKAHGPKGGPAPLSGALVAELTAFRTLALRDALGRQPGIALVAVTHALAAQAFFPHEGRISCLEITSRSASLGARAPGIEDSPTAQAIALRHEAWAKRMPDAPEGLWAFVASLGDDERLALLAHCAALTLDAVQTAHASETSILAHADQVAETVSLDMRAHWQPTAKGYFARISKDRILEAVRQGVSPAAAENLATLKKAALAEAAEQRLQGRGWLPPLLRVSEAAIATAKVVKAA